MKHILLAVFIGLAFTACQEEEAAPESRSNSSVNGDNGFDGTPGGSFGPCPSDQFGGGGDSMPAGGEVTVPGPLQNGTTPGGAGNEAPPGWTPLNLNDPFADPGMGSTNGDELPTGGGEFDGSIADNTMMPDCGGGSQRW